MAALLVLLVLLTAPPRAHAATGARITGSVKSEATGGPLPNIRIQAYRKMGSASWPYWVSWNSADTDALGAYDIGSLSAGVYRVWFTDLNGNYAQEFYDDQGDFDAAIDITLTAGATKAGINARLALGGHVTGTVTSEATDGPLPNALVTAYKKIGTEWDWAGYWYTNASGFYDARGLQGTYRFQFYDFSPNYVPEYFDDAVDVNSAVDVTVSAGATRPGINARLASAGHITGTLTSEATGGPLPNIYVIAYRKQGTYWDWSDSAYTDASGFYRIDCLRAGTYRMSFNEWRWRADLLPGFYDNAGDIYDATDISVTTGATRSGINARLSQPSHITGTVTSEATGGPLPDIYAVAYEKHGTSWDWNDGAYTDGSGSYDIPGLRAGTYRVSFNDHGRGSNYAPEFYDNAPDLDHATDITVTGSSTRAGINASLATWGRIAGTVSDEAGTPLAGIRVTVHQFWQDWGGWWDSRETVLTDASGAYDIGRLPTGTYRLRFFDPMHAYVPEYYDNAGDIETAADVTATVGSTHGGIDAKLDLYGRIGGVITDQVGGAPLPGITAEAFRYSYGWWQWTRSADTTASGEYELKGLLNGTYRVSFSDAGKVHAPEYFDDELDLSAADDVTVTVNTLRTGVNAQLAAGSHIGGTVTSDATGGAIPGVRVVVMDFARSTSGYEMRGRPTTVTDASGGYDISGLAPGAYAVRFLTTSGYLGEYFDDAKDIGSAKDVTLTSGANKTGVDARLATASHIVGSVRNAADHTALGGIQVSAIRFVNATSSYQFATRTDSFGSYDLGGLEEGSYRLSFYDPRRQFATEYYDDKADLWSATEVTVTAGATRTGIDAELATWSHITGTVRRPDGQAAHGCWVIAYGKAGRRWDWAGYDWTDYYSGSYDLGRLAAGTYRLWFSPRGTYAPEFYDDKPDLKSATDVTLTPAMTKPGIDATLSLASAVANGHIIGAVRTETGGVVPECWVRAYRYASGRWQSSNWSSTNPSSGTYDISRLIPGAYRVRFGAEGYVDEYYDDAPSLAAAKNVTVTAGASTSGIDAVLSQGSAYGKITGTVKTEATGGPVPNIDVSVFVRRGEWWDSCGWTLTSSSGAYELGSLDPGSYRVGFSDQGGRFVAEHYSDAVDIDSAADITLTAGLTRGGIDARLTAAAHVAGTVTSADSGAGLEGVRIAAYARRSGEWIDLAGTWTDERGAYDLGGLAADVYRIHFMDIGRNGYFESEYYDDAPAPGSAANVTVTVGAVAGGVDAALSRRLHGGRIAGLIRSDATGGPLPDIRVEVCEPRGDSWSQAAFATTGRSGRYQVGGIAAGRHRLRFMDPSGMFLGEAYENTATIEGGSDVNVVSETIVTVDASLATAGHVTGTVVETQTDDPLDGIEVAARAFSSPESGYWFRVMTDARGAYDLGGLGTDTYTLRFCDYEGVYATEYFDAKGTTGAAANIDVTAGGTYGPKNAALKRRGRIGGRVTSTAGGAPLSGIAIAVYDFANPYSGYEFRTSTDGSGAYSVDELDTGTYSVRFFDWNSDYADEYYNDASDEGAAASVPLGPGTALTTIDAQLSVSSHITGRITASDRPAPSAGRTGVPRRSAGGAPLAGVSVRAFLRDHYGAWVWVRTARSGTDGWYDLGGLAPGVYRLFITGNADYSPSYSGGSGTLQGAADISVDAGTNVTGVDVTLLPKIDRIPPGPVTNLGATPGNGQVSLTWSNPSTDFFAARILRSSGGPATSPTPSATHVQVYEGTGSSKTDAGLTNGTTYTYTAFARDATGNWSTGASVSARPVGVPVEPPVTPGDSIPPGPVTNLVVAPGNRQVGLTWTNPSVDFSAARILRSSVGPAASPTPSATHVQVYEGAGSSKIDTSVANGTTYYYTAYARDAAGNWSTPVSASARPVAPLPERLAVPKLVPASPKRGKSLVISGTLTPAHSSRTGVTLYLYRYVRGWKLYRVRPKAVLAPRASKYKITLKLPYSGRWYVKAWHSCAVARKLWSAKRAFRVR